MLEWSYWHASLPNADKLGFITCFKAGGVVFVSVFTKTYPEQVEMNPNKQILPTVPNFPPINKELFERDMACQ